MIAEADLNPEIQYFHPTSLSPVNNEYINIYGKGFSVINDSPGAPVVFFNNDECTVIAYNNSWIKCLTSNITIGQFDVYVFVPGLGNSNQKMISSTSLYFSNITPNRGSLLGETVVTVVGTGFGSAETEIQVKLGEYQCAVKNVTDTEITCITSSTEKFVYVDNSGSSPGRYLTRISLKVCFGVYQQ